MKDVKSILPWLWVFMVLNYLYCDVVSLFDPAVMKNELLGRAADGTFQITPGFLLAAGVLMEIPMAMVIVGRVLPHRASRWANVVAAAFMAIVQLGSLTTGKPEAYYYFFSVIEIGTLFVIAALALRWTGSWEIAAQPAMSSQRAE